MRPSFPPPPPPPPSCMLSIPSGNTLTVTPYSPAESQCPPHPLASIGMVPIASVRCNTAFFLIRHQIPHDRLLGL